MSQSIASSTSIFQSLMVSMCQTPSETQTDKRTDGQRQTDRPQESNLGHFSLKMWTLVAIFYRFSW